jgi:hypothetical protein
MLVARRRGRIRAGADSARDYFARSSRLEAPREASLLAHTDDRETLRVDLLGKAHGHRSTSFRAAASVARFLGRRHR